MASEQTVRDFYFECMMYEHSQECFDLMKECMELQLEEKYLHNEAFSLFGECTSVDYLREEAEKNPEKTNGFVAKLKQFGTKAWDIMKKIGKLFANLFKKFINFLKKVMNKSENNQIVQTINILKKCNLTEEDITKMVDIAVSVYDNINSKSVDQITGEYDDIKESSFDPKRSRGNDNGIKFPSGIDQSSKNIILSALATESIDLYYYSAYNSYNNEKDSVNRFMYPIDKMIDYINQQIKIIKTGSPYRINNLTSYPYNKIKGLDSDSPVTIYLSGNKLQKLIDKLMQTQENLINTINDASANYADAHNGDMEIANTLSSTYSDVIVTIGAYIGATTRFMQWRQVLAPKFLEVAKEIQSKHTEQPDDSNVNESTINGIDALVSFMFG